MEKTNKSLKDGEAKRNDEASSYYIQLTFKVVGVRTYWNSQLSISNQNLFESFEICFAYRFTDNEQR
jgi:hypothetical protein